MSEVVANEKVTNSAHCDLVVIAKALVSYHFVPVVWQISQIIHCDGASHTTHDPSGTQGFWVT